MSSKRTSTQLALSTLAGLSIASWYLYYRYKSQQPRRTLRDLQGNFYATGSDVCRLYANRIPGLVVVITGTSSGLGAHTAKLLGTHGALVILGNRRPDAVVELVQAMEHGGGQAISLELDLASLASVQSFARQVQERLAGQNIHVLIHNAGVSFLNGATPDGYQRVWQVNALAPSLLTELLLPSICPENGRVISISSEMHRACFGNVVEKCPPNQEKGKSASDYALSKACQILQALELTHRTIDSNKKIQGFAIEPGLVRTNIGRHTSQPLVEMEYFLLGPLVLRSVDQGCSSTLFCALAPREDLGTTGGYYFANCLPKPPKFNCSNLDDARRLQQLCYDIWKSYL
jgi:NAD(P)-dependent dehydrogenase (short-subunit alcohol dehydrogenase family)